MHLEGDPNCDYTTKVRIAGSEYNVIIDTGSAHFAVASNACKNCVIQREDHFRPNEEEEIPIDADGDLADTTAGNHPSSATGGDQRQQPQQPWNLLKERPNKTQSIPESLSPSASSRPAQDAFHVGANLRFPDNRDRLKKLQAEAAAMANAIRPIVPAGHPLDSDHHHGPLSSPNTSDRAAHKKSGAFGPEGRALAAAPAENLYPLSIKAREQGESIRVSYGIKTHSVGWSGVMTSDLMTVDMAKVNSGVITNITDASTKTTTTTDAPGTYHLEDGGTMEKETNVGFAAIMENTGFFSQECGAQHGIWGLGYRSLSVDHKPTLFDTLSASMKIPNGFALQLCGRVGNTTKSGNMFLGGYSSSHLAEPMQFVPLVKRDWYQVRLDGFKVMGQPVRGIQNLNLPKAIVDSGTTNILMSHYNLQFLIDALAQSGVVQWSSLIPEQDVNNFWFRNAVLRIRFEYSTGRDRSRARKRRGRDARSRRDYPR
ncbi:Beta-secretase 2 [Linnemannia gamsii]|uniref:Beta-secretase 2 n=1 Tax=Linnemannia gamsii TaxID=64522 RepID=A0A9P6UVM6_9FUNG|nr:Beta-secretase 2 [Linnemannia gamsii]